MNRQHPSTHAHAAGWQMVRMTRAVTSGDARAFQSSQRWRIGLQLACVALVGGTLWMQSRRAGVDGAAVDSAPALPAAHAAPAANPALPPANSGPWKG